MFSYDEEIYVKIAAEFGTPIYVYGEKELKKEALALKQFPAPYEFTPRFALKALPTQAILQILNSMDIHFDVSSGYEIERALLAGIPATHLSISSQELCSADLLKDGVQFNACSLKQLRW